MTDAPERGMAALDRIVDPIFYRTRPFPCSYLPDRNETRVLTEVTPEMAAGGFFDFLQHYGFRRSQRYLYRPVCEGCSACIPVRIPVARFAPNRTMRRLARLNADLSAHFVPPQASAEQFALFARYQAARHRDSDMATMGFEDYRALVEETPVKTEILELRDALGTLWGCALTDVGQDSLSAVYSFYTPTPTARSLGTFLVLTLLDAAAARGLPYLYLGYWIAECRKMAYKTKFSPLERFDGHRWQEG